MEQTTGAGVLKILLVEDHWVIARLMVTMLESLGYQAVAASTVAAAVVAAQSQRFDLLISDYSLPDGTGMDVLTKLRPTGLVKAIMITAYGQQFFDSATHAGFAKYLQKPVETEALAAAIKEVAAGPVGN